MEEKKRRRKMVDINYEVPPEILELIFSKLPFFNLPTCRLVCKLWNNLVLTLSCKFADQNSNLFFAHTFPSPDIHCIDLDLDPTKGKGINFVASFSFPSSWTKRNSRSQSQSRVHLQIVNSANGLLCFIKTKVTRHRHQDLYRHRVGILNPMTNEYIMLPNGDLDRHRHSDCYYGFGFNPKTKEYKLVRHWVRCKKEITMVEILAFGRNRSSHQWQWTPVASPVTIASHAVYFNGYLYFFASFSSMCHRFDLQNDIFQQISFPQLQDAPLSAPSNLGVFNANLYLTSYSPYDRQFHLWKMMEQQHSQHSYWTKVSVVDLPESFFLRELDECLPNFNFKFLKSCDDGNILCIVHRTHFALYDPKNGTLHKLDRFKNDTFISPIESFNFDSLRNILVGGDDDDA